jgi:Flp pilus assembly protein TadD
VKRIKATAIAVSLLPLYGCASLPSFADLFQPVPTTPTAPVKTVSRVQTPNGPQDIESAILEAQNARKSGDLNQASRILSQLVLVASDEPRVLAEYGKTLTGLGRSDDAVAFLERATQLSPSDWSLYSALGVAYDQKGNYQAAQSLYDRALALKPGDPGVLNNAALSHMQAGDLDGAERLLHQVAPGTPDYARIAQNLELIEKLKAAQPVKPAEAAPPGPAAAAAPAPVVSIAQPVAPAAGVAVDTAAPLPPPAPVAMTEEAPPAAPMQLIASALRQTPAAPETTANERSPLEILKADPTVRMQTFPIHEAAAAHEDQPAKPAVPKVVAAAVPAPKPVASPSEATPAAKPAVPKVVAVATPAPKPVPSPSEPTPAAAKPAVAKVLAAAANPVSSPSEATETPVEQVHVTASGAYYVQAGAFYKPEQAEKAASGLDRLGAHVMTGTTVQGRAVFRVRIGPFRSKAQANTAVELAQGLGRKDLQIVME